ncbi:MAG: DUF4492 domain-containing protein [Bacteroidales bacterium]|nr:DUF4492 domain-containing protein [Bacteroidales bacterium]
MKDNIFVRIFRFYVDGFKSMTIGKTLWTIIIIKLIVIFLVLKLFFFPNYIKENAEEGNEADFIMKEILTNER